MLLIITSTGDRFFLDLLTSITLNDLEPPPKKKGFFSELFAIFGRSAHFNTELRQNGWRPR